MNSKEIATSNGCCSTTKCNSGAKPLSLKPGVELVESDSGYELSVDLPGVKKDSVTLEVENNELTLSAKATFGGAEKKTLLHQEWGMGESQYSQTFRLPAEANSESISAAHENGVLKIRIPKRESASNRKIEVH